MTEPLQVHLTTAERPTPASSAAAGDPIHQSDSDVIAKLTMTDPQRLAQKATITDAEKITAFESLESSCLSKYFVKDRTTADFADCPHNTLMIESVARIRNYIANNKPLQLAEETKNLAKIVIGSKIPEHKTANHDVRLESTPQGLSESEAATYHAARNAVIQFVQRSMKAAKYTYHEPERQR
jgi:hypothetical protein